ncbi:TIGR03560 family F420-dependent LLM class oxidoreductase [Streptomyces sp. NPDC059917]|uniref:TIGR03560 family F420-dependent LLM class oxidoreductase n=1 Tax=Streptomyces sp. NPDC059917 TaxID=3347002 RepID=UPI0036697D26
MSAPVTRLGLQFAGYSFPGVPDAGIFTRVAEVAVAAENSGFDSLWTMDHLQQIDAVGDREEPILEAYTTLAALAAVTRSAKLGVLVTACGFRNPALLAKMVTSIDVISGGRAILGIGGGWHEEEYHAYGMPFPSTRDRMQQLAEAVQICRAMFTECAPEFAGRHHRIAQPLNSPSPISRSGPPILIGGGGERVLIPTVAKFGDACNFFGAPATVRHKIEVLTRACESVGRDPDEITKTWLGHVLISDNEQELQIAVDRLARLYHLSPRATRGFALCGTEADVLEQLANYRSVGVDGVIVTVLDSGDVDYVRRVGETLRKGFDD